MTDSLPSDYLRWHRLAADPHNEGWRDAIDHLATSGDQFTLDYMTMLDHKSWSPPEVVVYDATVARLRTRLPPIPIAASGIELETILERAAWANVKSDPFENQIVPWTKRYIESIKAAPGVRADLERIKTSYKPRYNDATLVSALSKRVPEYATEALKSAK